MDKEHEREMIRCAQNKSMTIRPDTQHREQIARFLMQAGYLIPKISQCDPNFELEELPDVFNVLLTLTDQGKGYLLALSPEDFDYTGRSWPTADDIRQVQRRLSAGSG
jgi:hypothetical protein